MTNVREFGVRIGESLILGTRKVSDSEVESCHGNPVCLYLGDVHGIL